MQFNTKASNGLRFTVDDAQLDTVTRSVDLEATAVHEFGHSLGLAHSYINQTSPTDGTAATMFPFIDTGDPQAEVSMRTLHPDDVAWASYFYPEGTSSSGPAKLQPGDIRFRDRYGIVTGNLSHGVLGQPIAGGHLFAVDLLRRSVVSGAYSGTTRLSFNPVTGGLFFLPRRHRRNRGRPVLDSTPARLVLGWIPSVDGQPAAPGNISFTCQIGGFFGQLGFNDEFHGFREADVECIRASASPCSSCRRRAPASTS